VLQEHGHHFMLDESSPDIWIILSDVMVLRDLLVGSEIVLVVQQGRVWLEGVLVLWPFGL
jgi:hypothetical protein